MIVNGLVEGGHISLAKLVEAYRMTPSIKEDPKLTEAYLDSDVDFSSRRGLPRSWSGWWCLLWWCWSSINLDLNREESMSVR